LPEAQPPTRHLTPSSVAHHHCAFTNIEKKYGLRDILTSPLEGLDDTGLAFFLKQRQAEKQQGGLF